MIGTFTKAGLLELVDRLRRQAVDVVGPVLALVAAGQVSGLDLAGTVALLVGGSAATVVGWLMTAQATTLWQRALVTLAGAFVAVAGSDWQGWLDLDAKATAIAVAASVLLALLRTMTSGGQVGPASGGPRVIRVARP